MHPGLIALAAAGVLLTVILALRYLRVRGANRMAPGLHERDDALGPATALEEAVALLNDQGDPREARRRLRGIVTRYPGLREPWTLLAQAYLDAGDPDEAIEVYTQALTHLRSDPDVYFARAGAHMVAGQPARALSDYDAILEEHADRIDAWIGKSRALLALNRAELAAEFLGEAEERFDADPALLRPLAEAYFEAGDYEAALECWEAHLQAAGDDAEVLRGMAAAHRHRGDTVAAAECLRRADQAAPENPLLCEDAAQALLEAGRFDEAAQAYAAARAAGLESPAAVLRNAEALHGAGRPEEAYAALVELLDLDAEGPADRVARATALLRLGLAEEALAEADALAAEGNRHRLSALLVRLEALHGADRLGEAAQVWRELVRGRYESPNAMGRLYWLGLQLGETSPDPNPSWLGEHLEQRPHDRFVRLGRASALRARGDLAEALQELDAIVARNPSDEAALRERGAILAELGRDEEAARDLEEADRSQGLRQAAADRARSRPSTQPPDGPAPSG